MILVFEERVEVEVLYAKHEGEREHSRNIHERLPVLHVLYNDRASCLAREGRCDGSIVEDEMYVSEPVGQSRA